MIRLPVAIVSVVCLTGLFASDAEAQYLNQPGYYGGVPGYNPGYYGQTDPRLGYCLENDCFTPRHSGYPCGGGCGCQSPAPSVIVRVWVNGQPTTPVVRMVTPYPGCYGCGIPGHDHYGNKSAPQNQRFVGTRQAPPQPRGVQARPSTTRKAGYRYKF